MNEKASSPRPFDVLLVEDNDDDVLLTKHAFKNLSVVVKFHVASDGVEALKFLRHAEPYGDAPLPHIILLDLNMPRMDGRKFLAELKQDEYLKIIPTVILTTSNASDDVSTAYRNHASAYMTKPIDVQEFAHRTECFVEFWLSNVTILPSSLVCELVQLVHPAVAETKT
jgi:CheY-like chemotaxis protein